MASHITVRTERISVHAQRSEARHLLSECLSVGHTRESRHAKAVQDIEISFTTHDEAMFLVS